MKKIIITVLAGLFLLITGSGNTGNTIKIGLITNATGPTARDTLTSRFGTIMAINEINKKGGILGKKVELIQYDNESTSIGSKIAADRAVKDGVTAVLGCHFSSFALAAADVLQKNRIPLITDTATHTDVTLKGDYIFRVCFTDDFQGAMLAKLAAVRLKGKTITSIIDTDSKYSMGLSNTTLEEFKKLGGKINNIYKVKGFEKELKDLEKIKNDKSDIILITSYTLQTALFIKAIRNAGIKSALIGGDTWSDRIITYVGGVEGTNYFISGWSTHLKNDTSKKFTREFNRLFSESSVSQSAALAYDAAWLLAGAINRAGTTESEKVRESIKSTADFKGITGTISFDSNRNPRKPAVLNRISGKTITSEYFN